MNLETENLILSIIEKAQYRIDDLRRLGRDFKDGKIDANEVHRIIEISEQILDKWESEMKRGESWESD